MTHDIVIRGGLIVDGTGADPFVGDIAIDGDTITQVGEVEGEGRREIDAGGLAVSPGFVDIHTHLDAQIGWDPEMTPISWHGVTTALIGNCGLSFAPCRPGDKDLLAGMMETVEDIPKDAILSGLPWDWESYPEYLDFLERSRPALNVAGLIGHSAVRFYVMGERSVEEDASEEEIRQMAEIVGKAVEGGAVGFSTNRHEPHKMPDGRSIPGTFAAVEELEAIAQAVGPLGGMMQAVGADFKTLSAVADAADSRGLFIWRMFSTDLKEQADLFKSKNLLPSLGDVGAHVSQIMDAGWCSFMLSHWVRKAGVFSLAEAVRRMTSAPARVIGLADRGVLAPGMRADINVFDPDAVTELQPEVVHDFPGGTPRYIQRSKGYKATLVNGQVNMMDGESTGARAGRVLRHRALAQAAE